MWTSVPLRQRTWGMDGLLPSAGGLGEWARVGLSWGVDFPAVCILVCIRGLGTHDSVLLSLLWHHVRLENGGCLGGLL